MKVSTLFNGLILLSLVVLLVVSLDYPWTLKLLPCIFISLALAFVATQILREILTEGKAGDTAESSLKVGEWIARLKGTDQGFLVTVGWIIGLLLSVYVLGFVAAIPLFTILYLKLHGESWRFSIGLPVLVCGILYTIFVSVLEVPLYEGLLFSEIFK